MELIGSGSRAKGTAISLASDVDWLISLTSDCNENNGGLRGIFESLVAFLTQHYAGCRVQNVSVRLNLSGLEVDVTPARRQPGLRFDHWVYLSKDGSRRQTNIHKHIRDIAGSGRTDEIKLLKVWRELHHLDFPSIYLEYLLVDRILLGRRSSPDSLADNFAYVLSELALNVGNPLNSRIVDPANSSNVLSNLLTEREKGVIIDAARRTKGQRWEYIVW